MFCCIMQQRHIVLVTVVTVNSINKIHLYHGAIVVGLNNIALLHAQTYRICAGCI